MIARFTLIRFALLLTVVAMLLSACAQPAAPTSAPAPVQPTTAPTVAPTQAPPTAAPTAVPTKVPPTATVAPKTLRITIDSWLIQKWPIEDAAKAFMAAHPNVKVSVAPNADDYGNNWLLPWTQGQTESDLMCGGMDTTLSPFVAKDLLVPLDDMLVDDGKINLKPDQFVTPLLEASKYGTHYYAMPFMGEVYYLTVNTEMMKKAGLTDASGKPIPPKNLDEWYEYAKKLTVKDASGKVQVWGLHINWGANSAAITYMALLQAQKGTYWNDAKKNMDFTGQAARDVMTFARKVVADGYASSATVTDENADRNDMKAGKAAMILTFHSRFKEAQTALGGTDKATVMPWPGSDERGSNAQAIVCVIPKISPVIDVAKQFIREQMTDKANQQWSANKFGKLPALKRNFDGLPDPEYKTVLQSLDRSGFGPKFVQFNELDKLLQQETQKYILGKQALDATLKNLQDGSSKLDLSLVAR
jgi:multiple sugar transport system substrate-binding protein